jgi:cell division protein FtsB
MKKEFYIWDMNNTQTHTMKPKTTTHTEVQLMATIRQLEKQLEAKHKDFVQERARADYYEMLYKGTQA